MSTPFQSTGPHIHSQSSIARTMWTIVLAMLPVTTAAVVFFGPKALYPIFGSALFSVLLEYLFKHDGFSTKTPLGDGSAFVAGMILGLSLAPGAAWWIPPLGAFILIAIGKQAFGGIGNNIFNPALVSRAVLLLGWPRYITGWVTPFDGTTTATPLEGFEASYTQLFLGNIPGSLGETSALAILLGAAYLTYKGLINWKVPVSVIAGGVAAALLFGLNPIHTVLAGSLLFGAVFMATDMVTSPTGKTSHIVFGFGCGFLTVFIRRFTHLPEGVTYAFLLMNGSAYLIDRIGADPIFGQVQERVRRVWNTGEVLGAAVLIALVVAIVYRASDWVDVRFSDGHMTAAVRTIYPQANRIIAMESYDNAVARYRVYHDRTLIGLFASLDANGYGGTIPIWVGLDPDENITAVRIGPNQESPTLGSAIRRMDFLTRFEGARPAGRENLPDDIAAITGATISSRAVIRAVERILAAGDPETAKQAAGAGAPLPTVADGTYSGSGRGYQGPIAVSVQVVGGRVDNIEVTSHSDTVGIGTRAMDAIKTSIIQNQSLGVDAVTGATGSSQGIIQAVRNALENAPAQEEP